MPPARCRDGSQAGACPCPRVAPVVPLLAEHDALNDGRSWPGGRGTGDPPDNLCFGVAGAPDRTSDPANRTRR